MLPAPTGTDTPSCPPLAFVSPVAIVFLRCWYWPYSLTTPKS